MYDGYVYSDDRKAFEEAINASPYDDTISLIYADWLEERGDPLGLFLRIAMCHGRNMAVDTIIKNTATYLNIPTEAIHPRDFYSLWDYKYNDCDNLQRLLTSIPNPEKQDEWIKNGKRIIRERGWLSEAKQGNVKAALAHPVSREAVRLLVRGVRVTGISGFKYMRRTVAAAKALLAEREKRRRDYQIANPEVETNRYHKMWISKLQALAVVTGREYHRKEHKLYQSKYADVVYGRGGELVTDRERYSKKWHNSYGPATCLMAGARLDNETKPTCVILENYRGTEIVRIPLKECNQF